jgi:hypothetical protein
MIMEQKEKEEKVDAQKSTGKNMKLYMVCSFVAGLCMAFFIANLIGGCDERHEVNNTARYANVERTINDVMREKEIVDGMKVDGTWKHGMDSIGIFEKDGKRGFYSLNTDKVLVPATYTHACFFSEGLAAVEKDGKIGFINMKGALVIPYQFVHRTNDRPDIVFKDGRCVMANGNGQMGVIDRKGEWVVKPQYEKVDLTESGIFATTSNSKSLLSNKGEVLQKDLVVKVEPLTCNVQLKEKDAEGRWRLQDVEMRMDYYVYYTFAYNNRCGLMDKDGNRLTEPVYSKIEALNEHLFSFYLLDGETQFVKSL